MEIAANTRLLKKSNLSGRSFDSIRCSQDNPYDDWTITTCEQRIPLRMTLRGLFQQRWEARTTTALFNSPNTGVIPD